MPVLSRKGTTVGGPRKGSRTKKPKAAKYISKKKAYKPKIKRTQVRRRAPLVETKTRTDQEVVGRMSMAAASYYNQVPTTFHPWPQAGSKVFPLKLFCLDSQQQGVDEDMVLGRSIFSKYLKMKIQLKFPSVANTVFELQPDIYIVHGFVKNSPNLNGQNTVNGVQDPGHWSFQNDWDWIRDQLAPYFNDREDKLAYIPKNQSHLRILGYHRVKPKQTEGFGRPRTSAINVEPDPDVQTTLGSLRDYHRTLKWPMMRKVHYEIGRLGEFSEANGSIRSNNLYINTQQWRPFACLYCPTMGLERPGLPTLVPANVPEVAYNGIMYYTDS